MDFLFFNKFHISEILLFLFILTALLQLYYYLYFFSRVAFRKEKRKNARKEPVSVIICAKNEAENLSKHLPAILTQNYPDYEVIVVDDCSEDNTSDVLEGFQKKYPHLKITNIKKDLKFTHGKKLALTIGIKAAQNEWLLLTDADCKPETENWITTMQKNFSRDSSIVLGYGGYYSRNSFLNNYIRFDTFFIALQYLGMALAGFPYMGIGRNLAYRRSLFFKNKGFASHRKIASGDDDLFINQTATKINTKVEYNFKSHIRAEPKDTIIEWVKQKKRHLSTGWHYNAKTKWLLGGELAGRVLFYILFVFLISNLWFKSIVAGIFLLRFICMAVIFKFAMKRLNEKYLFIPSFFYDFISPIIIIFFVVLNKFSSPDTSWK